MEHRISVSKSRPKQTAPKNAVDETGPKDVYRKRKSSGLSPFDRVAWETMTKIQEKLSFIFICRWARTTPFCFNGREMDAYRIYSLLHLALSGALLAMCSDESVSSKANWASMSWSWHRNI
ncbi:putative F-box/RNI/FBD-like domain protein, partial [Trifolium medium]|nr:putative F-box/RNI/FBD-like domain protein [Trifolium medium]